MFSQHGYLHTNITPIPLQYTLAHHITMLLTFCTVCLTVAQDPQPTISLRTISSVNLSMHILARNRFSSSRSHYNIKKSFNKKKPKPFYGQHEATNLSTRPYNSNPISTNKHNMGLIQEENGFSGTIPNNGCKTITRQVPPPTIEPLTGGSHLSLIS